MFFSTFGNFLLYLTIFLVFISLANRIVSIFNDSKIVTKLSNLFFLAATVTVFGSFLSQIGCFLQDAFDVQSVFYHSAEHLSISEKISASWAGKEGSMLLFTFLLFLVTSIMILLKYKKIGKSTENKNQQAAKSNLKQTNVTNLILQLFSLFFLIIIIFFSHNPFKLIPQENLVEAVENAMKSEMMQGQGEFLQLAELIDSTTANADTKDLNKKAELIVQHQHEHGISIFKDGRGLNPILRNFYMIIHPVSIYAGYIFLFPVFALLLTSLIFRRKPSLQLVKPACLRVPQAAGEAKVAEYDKEHKTTGVAEALEAKVLQGVDLIRNWLVLSFIFLAAGNILGGLWAYEVIGWGGFWSWDPVENSSLIPWLFSIAAMHSVWQFKRNLNFGKSVYVFSFQAFFTCIWSMWITRSGVSDSVHAFAEESTIFFLLLGFLVVVVSIVAFFAIKFLIKFKSNLLTDSSHLSPFAFDYAQAPTEIEQSRNRMLSGKLQKYFHFANITIFVLAAMIFVMSYAGVFTRLFGDEGLKIDAFHLTSPFFILLFVILALTIVKFYGIKRFRLSFVISGLAVLLTLFGQLFYSPFTFTEMTNIYETTGESLPWLKAIITLFTPVLILGISVFIIVVITQGLAKNFRKPRNFRIFILKSGGAIAHIGVCFLAIGIVFSSAFSYPTDKKETFIGKIDKTNIEADFPAFVDSDLQIVGYEIGMKLKIDKYPETRGKVDSSSKYVILSDAEFPLAYFGKKTDDCAKILKAQNINLLDDETEQTPQTQTQKSVEKPTKHRMQKQQFAHAKRMLNAFFNLDFTADLEEHLLIKNIMKYVLTAEQSLYELDYFYYRIWVEETVSSDANTLFPLNMRIHKGFERMLSPKVQIISNGLNDLYIAPLTLPDKDGQIKIMLRIKPFMQLSRLGLIILCLSSILLIFSLIFRFKDETSNNKI